MTEYEGEIEYLEEDAEIVQQCVHTVQLPVRSTSAAINATAAALELTEKLTPLLVERTKIDRRKKRKKDEEDSDYDPSEDFVPPSPPSPPSRKKKLPPPKKIKLYRRAETVPDLKRNKEVEHFSGKEKFVNRKKCNIRIPNYEDPLCLPVKAIKQEAADLKRLENWNNVCLEHFKHCDTILKPERGETNSSTRTIVFRNVVNKQSGKVETTIWSKTCVKNEDAERKAEIFQCVLPRYKEKQVLTMYNLASRKPKPFHLVDEVILSKEDTKDGEALVVYKPNEALSAVYTMVNNRKSKADDNDDDIEDEEMKMYLKELTCCRVCAPCFQTSWRGVNKNQKKNLVCPICARTYVTVYNLLAHFKTHSPGDVRKYKRIISTILSEIVDYHYKCRICRDKFESIKQLRRHVTIHQGNEMFHCEVGNHTTT